MITLREMAAAKINLYLHVTGRRANGYHELDSWVVFAEIGDTLEAAKSDALRVEIQGVYAHSVPKDDNSIIKAARALAAHYKVVQGATITLTKRLPVAAGIGGGSADAAAALRLLVRLWGLAPRAGELEALAASLGADVPVCLRSESLYMNGVGEVLSDAPVCTGWPVVLVNPGKALSTPQVFGAREGDFSSAMRHPSEFASLGGGVQFLRQAKNDLQPAAVSLVPEVEMVLAALDVQGGCLMSRMSGSGATCYGIYTTQEDARQAATRLAAAYPEWWVQESKLK